MSQENCARCDKLEEFLGNKRCACCNQFYCYECYDEHQQQVLLEIPSSMIIVDQSAPYSSKLVQVGRQANEVADRNALQRYQKRLKPRTLTRHQYDLAVFQIYLLEVGIWLEKGALYQDMSAWEGMTHGLVEGFVEWMLNDGYAMGSVNLRLSTVKAYVKCMARAGIIEPTELALISLVECFGYGEGKTIDADRAITRKSTKAAQPIPLTYEQLQRLKEEHPDTPQGWRDRLLMCLLCDHGLRCGEVFALTQENLHLDQGLLIFDREKVDLDEEKHRLTADTMVAAHNYLQRCMPVTQLLMGSRKSKTGTHMQGGMSRRAIHNRIAILGKRILEIEGLSPHMLRHAWVDAAIRGKTDVSALKFGGGWKSEAMVLKYMTKARIANEGVHLA